MTIEEFKDKFGIIGNTKEIRDLVDIIMQVAVTDITVLIYGESGAGKEIFAKAIHDYSGRANKSFLSVNCGAIPEGILESELFGHKKGSFTGAFDSRKGYFEISDGGTLFLDEIADMPLMTQVKLLRAIETGEFIKIGDETVTKVNVRIIAATNKDLQQEVNTKRFREDLYFRLKAVTLSIPPLRKRKSDIEEFARHFISAFVTENKMDPPVLTQDAIELLKNYDWPGNVRELKNTLESAVTLNRNGILDAKTFSSLLKKPEEEAISRNLPVFLNKSSEELDRELMYRALFEIKKDLIELKDLIYHQGIIVDTGKNNRSDEIIPLDQLEKDAIKNALEQTHGNKRNAAKMLKISERTLYRKIKEYDLL
jgi:DNA-binding NtrC family response regulator